MLAHSLVCSMDKLSSENFPDCFHRVSVKGLCVVDGKLLLVKESESLSGQWELPGGGLDFGEVIRGGLEREVEEELGLNVISVAKTPTYTWTAKFEGWRDMDWYYSLVLAYQIEMENFDFKPSEEAEEIGFFAPEELNDLDLFLQSEPLRKMFKLSDF